MDKMHSLVCIHESNFGASLVHGKNVEPFVLVNGFVDLIGLEALARTSLLNFGYFQSALAANGHHFSNDIVDPINDRLGLARAAIKLVIQRIL